MTPKREILQSQDRNSPIIVIDYCLCKNDATKREARFPVGRKRGQNRGHPLKWQLMRACMLLYQFYFH